MSTAWQCIVFWVDVEEANFADALASWIARNGRNVKDTDSSTVAGLIVQTVVDVLVVVDSTMSQLVVTGDLWCSQVSNVDDVGDWKAISSSA